MGISILFFLFFLFFFGIRYDGFLYLAQNGFLFTWNGDLFLDMMEFPGGFLEYWTVFLVQFFYFPLAGGVILALLLLLLQKEMEVFCRFQGLFWIFSFLPSCLCAVLLISFKYLIFEVVPVQYIFSIPIGFSFALAYAIFYSRERQKRDFPRISFLLLFLLFPLLGFYALFGIFLAFIHEWNLRREKKTEDSNGQKGPFTLNAEILLLAFLLVPLVWYFYYQKNTNYANLYFAATFFTRYIYRSFFNSLYSVLVLLPFFTGAVFLLPLIFGTVKKSLRTPEIEVPKPDLSESESSGAGENEKTGEGDEGGKIRETQEISKGLERSVPGETEKERTSSQSCSGFLITLFLFFFMGGTLYLAPHTSEFFSIIAMARPLDQENWDQVLRIEQRCPESNLIRPTIMLRFLALFEKGTLGENLFKREQYGIQKDEIVNVSTVRMYGSFFLYRFGLFDHSAKIAMNNMITISHSAISMKNYVRAMVANGDLEIAEKYLPLLESSLFHADFAHRYRDYLQFAKLKKALSSEKMKNDSGKEISSILKEKLGPEIYDHGISVEEEIEKLRERRCSRDGLTNLQYPELILYHTFQNCPAQKEESLEKLELRLTIYLMMRSSKDFMENIGLYIEKAGNRPLPLHFREAIVVSCHSKSDHWDRANYPITLEDDKALMEYLRRSITARNEPANRKALAEKEKVNGTYWHYLFDVPEMPFY
ncbi:MAG: DUF6057 family protein [Planctomycetia bacterium]|nr:DUF6057 family protein [Planctomycetia bacterium]